MKLVNATLVARSELYAEAARDTTLGCLLARAADLKDRIVEVPDYALCSNYANDLFLRLNAVRDEIDRRNAIEATA